MSTTPPVTFAQMHHICIMRLSAIGDIINLVPSLELVLQRYPHLQVTWVIGKTEATLFNALTEKYPQLHLAVFDKKTSYWQARKQLAHLTSEPFDLLIHAQTSLRSNLLASFIKAKHKVGFSKARSFEGHGLVVQQQVPQQTSMHVLFDYFDLFVPFLTPDDIAQFQQLTTDTAALYQGSYPEALRLQQSIKPLVDFGWGSATSASILQQLQAKNIPVYQELLAQSKYQAPSLAGAEASTTSNNLSNNNTAKSDSSPIRQKIVLVNPASSALKKNWTDAGYVAVIMYLLQHDHFVVVTGSPNPVELELVKLVVTLVQASEQLTTAQKARLYNLAGQTTLKELVIFIQLADLVVSPDSGPMHLASCLGVPTIGLFAYINPMRSGPVQGIGDVISVWHQNFYHRPMQLTTEQYQLDLKNWRKKPQGTELMHQITTDQVIEKIAQVLSRLAS